VVIRPEMWPVFRWTCSRGSRVSRRRSARVPQIVNRITRIRKVFATASSSTDSVRVGPNLLRLDAACTSPPEPDPRPDTNNIDSEHLGMSQDTARSHLNETSPHFKVTADH
jgi:hypothetical protein